MKPLLCAVTLLVAAMPARADTFTIADKQLDVDRVRLVKLNFCAGEVRIVGTDAKQLRYLVRGNCKRWSWDHCRERAETITVRSDYDGSDLRLSLEGAPRHSNHGLEIEVILEVPRSLAVGVDMSAGELQARGLEGSVDFALGVGEVDLDLPEAAVESVDLHVSIGDASLRHHGRPVEASGWLGKRVAWDDGPGRSRVRVAVSVGEAAVRLR